MIDDTPAVLAAIDRLQKTVDRLIQPEKPVIGIKEIMFLTGTKSKTSARRVLRELGVKPYLYGKYMRVDVTNAMAQRKLMIAAKIEPKPNQ
jgi:hypothetical protein